MQPGKIYKVIWRDHFSETGWKDSSEVAEWVEGLQDTYCVTVGYLAHNTDDLLVIAGSHDGVESYGDFMAIYKDDIISMDTIE